MTLLAQAVTAGFDIWEFASKNGFSAVLVLLLLFWQRELINRMLKEWQNQRRSQDWATRANTAMLIQLGSLLAPGLKKPLERMQQEMHDAEHEEGKSEE